MSNHTQQIVLTVCINYEHAESDIIDLKPFEEEIELKAFEAFENERQQGALSPENLCCNYLTVEVDRLDAPQDKNGNEVYPEQAAG